MESEAIVVWGIRALTLGERELVMMVELSDLVGEEEHAEYQQMHWQFFNSLTSSDPADLFHEDALIVQYCTYFKTLLSTCPREQLFYNTAKNYFNNVIKN